MLIVSLKQNGKVREFTLADGATAAVLMSQAQAKVNPWDKVTVEGIGEIHADYKLADKQTVVIEAGDGPYTNIAASTMEELTAGINAKVLAGQRLVTVIWNGTVFQALLVNQKFV